MAIISILIAGLLYPGLLTALALGLLYRLLRGGPAWRGAMGALGAGVRSREGLAALAGILAASIGLAALPWPFHPARASLGWLWSWAGLELAFLLPLAPALAAGAPRVVRAAIRRAQIGALGRALLWAALAVALVLRGDWRLAALPAHLLALGAALLAFPIAIGWGPFDDEVSLTGAGVQAGLPPDLRVIDTIARDSAAGALLAAIMIAALPAAVGPAWLFPAVAGAGFLTVGALLGRLAGRMPRLALPAILRLCWTYVAPLAAAAAAAQLIAGDHA
jgi:hypothetical protein